MGLPTLDRFALTHHIFHNHSLLRSDVTSLFDYSSSSHPWFAGWGQNWHAANLSLCSGPRSSGLAPAGRLGSSGRCSKYPDAQEAISPWEMEPYQGSHGLGIAPSPTLESEVNSAGAAWWSNGSFFSNCTTWLELPGKNMFNCKVLFPTKEERNKEDGEGFELGPPVNSP